MKDANAVEVMDRLMVATGADSISALAAAIGVSHQSVYSARKGVIPPAWVLDVAKRFGTSTDWLFFGTGTMYDKDRVVVENAAAGMLRAGDPLTKVVSKTLEEAPPLSLSPEFTLVPLFREARLSAGHGCFEAEAGNTEHYAFRFEFLSRKGDPSRMVLMHVDGNSMEPAFTDGDMVLIDQSQTDLRPGKVYAVAVEGLVYLKLVNTAPGKLVLSSYNPAYPPLEFEIYEGLDETIHIVGRALWFGREI